MIVGSRPMSPRMSYAPAMSLHADPANPPLATDHATFQTTARSIATHGSWLGSIGSGIARAIGRLWSGIKRLFGQEPEAPATPATYTVKAGDTLSGIAQKTLGDSKRWPEIHALNRDQISNPNVIRPGMVLKLPGGHPVAAPAPTPVTGTPSDIASGLAIPAPGTNPSREVLDTLLSRAADKHGIPRPILKAVALRESNWRQYDANGNPVAGRNPSTTDWGIMQINDYWHPQAFPRAMTDVAFNIEYGATYLASQYKRYGDWKDAVAAYNAGSVKKDASGRYSNQPYVDFVFAHLTQFA